MRNPVRLAQITFTLLSLIPAAQSLAGAGALTGVVIAERDDRTGQPQLLIALPARVNGRPVDEVRLDLPGGLAKKLKTARLPAGWSFRANGVLTGPAVASPLISAVFSATGLTLPKAVEFEALGGGERLIAGTVTVGKLPALKTAAMPGKFLRLPQLLSPGEPVTFVPLWPEAGGLWQIAGETPVWNGDLADPRYSFTLQAEARLPLRISYTDPWGEKLLDGVADDVRLGAPAVSARPPALTGCSPKVLTGSPVCVCGSFPTEASRAAVTLNGKPLGGLLLSASGSVLNFRLPQDLPPGPFVVAGSPEAGFPASAKAGGLLIRVDGELDRDLLKKGQSTPMRLWLEGTHEPLELQLKNSTPEIISLEGGEEQNVMTSGGEPNQVVRTVHGHTPGDFQLDYALTLGSCPCAEKGWGLGVTVNYDSAATSTRTRADAPCDDCDELRRRAEAARMEARQLRHTAERAVTNRDWYGQQTRALADERIKDKAYLDTLRRQAGDLRGLEQNARASAETNRERNLRQPGQGWAAEAERDIAEAERRAGEAEKLEREASQLEARMAGKLNLKEALRQILRDSDARAAEAEQRAALAEAAYQACLSRRAPACPPVVVDDSAGPGDKPVPDYCGPDVSSAYLAAMQRVYQRMQQVPDGDKGPWDGAWFLARNGWAIDEWPNVPFPVAGQASCPSGACSRGGNDVGQRCFTLFSRCVPGHVLNDIMYGFTADLLHVPRPVQELGAHWAEASFNTPEGKAGKYPATPRGFVEGALTFADPKISQACYKLGSGMADNWDSGAPMGGSEIGAAIAGDWQGFSSELAKAYPWIASCRTCPTGAGFTGWDRDWSRATWNLSNGTQLAPPAH